MNTKFSRRQFLAGVGLTAAGAAAGGGSVLGFRDGAAASTDKDSTVPFYGTHQAGIVTEQQDRLCFAAFDLATDDVDAVRSMLREWTDAAVSMCKGKPTGSVGDRKEAPPNDTGEAVDLHAARLTITVGFGASFFDRLRLQHKRPPGLTDLPPILVENVDPSRSHGDICVQACADDPQVAFHAVRNLARIGRGTAVMRWNQLGFGRTATTSRTQGTPRNLMGLKDGTNNLVAEDVDLLNQHVWAQPTDGSAWMTNGTYLVTRRIRMLIEVWDRASLDDQEKTIGRHKASGAPIGKRKEHDPVDLVQLDGKGEPVVPRDAHIRLAAPENNDGARMLRRGYSFTDGMTDLGQLDAGLFFIAFVRNIDRQFVPVQMKLHQNDALNEYIATTSSAVFAIAPGVRPGGHFGDGIFS